MTTATVLTLSALGVGLVSAVVLAVSPNPVLDVLAEAASPTVIHVGRGPDVNAIAELGMRVRAGAELSRRRVRIGCGGLILSFALQAVALLV